MSDIKVSVCCVTYNHISYIRKCLESLITQKTDFKYEILIHDDASTDGTQNVIKEYEKQYPELIKPVYQHENQYSKGVKITLEYQYPRAKGKYIAFCEGDDYWTDEYKLQKQFEIMENNCDCSACVHKVLVVNPQGVPTNQYYPNINSISSIIHNKVILSDNMVDYLCRINSCPFHVSSVFIRSNILKDICINTPEFIKIAMVGDLPLLLLATQAGNIYYIDDIMSNYRENTPDGWNDRRLKNSEFRAILNKNFIQFHLEFDKYTAYKYHNSIMYYVLLQHFKEDLFKKDYNALLENKYKEIFNSLPYKTKIHIKLLSNFPKQVRFIEKFIYRN